VKIAETFQIKSSRTLAAERRVARGSIRGGYRGLQEGKLFGETKEKKGDER
jgi:hypothetical protein